MPNPSTHDCCAQLADVLLRERHVAVVPGSAFGPSGKGYLRLTCVRSWPDIREAMGRIRAALAEAPHPVRQPIPGQSA